MRKLSYLFKCIIIQFMNLFIKTDKNFWLFSSSFNTQFNYNSRYLFEYMLKNNSNIKCRFVINDRVKRDELTSIYGDFFIETNSLSGMLEALKAGIWFTSAGLPVYILSSKKNRDVVNLWHGVPLKKIGLLENNFNKLKRTYFRRVFSNNYSIIITTSEKLVDLMARSFGVPAEKIKVLGQPRNDLLTQTINEAWVKNNIPNIQESNKLLLYAPTYREFKKTKLFPFRDFNIKSLNEFLEEEKIIIFIRLHQSEVDVSLFEELQKSNRIKFINEDIVEDIMGILNLFDLLITDYSSIYIDHLIIEKPQLFIPYDLEEYIEKRGLNFDYNKYTPGPKVREFEDFKGEIKYLLNDAEYYKNERISLNNYFNKVRSNSCEKIVKYVKENLWEK